MISQFEPPAEDTLRRKRLKVTSACTSCRRRKTKCDGAQPCASCNKAKVECQYVASKNQVKETISGTQQRQQQQQQQQPQQQQQQQQLQQQQHSSFQHHRAPSDDQRRLSFNPQSLTKSRQSSLSSSATGLPATSRHSFSHFVTQPTPSRPRPTQEAPRRHTLTIASIEERLAAIERILRTLLESSVAHSALVNKDMAEKGLSTNADSMKGVRHPYLSENNNTISLPPPPPPSNAITNGSTDIARDYLRLPPIYNNNSNDPSSPSNKNHSNIITTTTISSSSSSSSVTTSLSPPPPSSRLERTGSTTGSTQRIIDHHGDAETSTPSLLPMITGFKRPRDATTGQVSTTLQPIYVTTTPSDHAVRQQQLQQPLSMTDHRSSSAGLDTLATPPPPEYNHPYTIQHPPYTTIPL